MNDDRSLGLKSPPPWLRWGSAAALLALVVAAYWPVRANKFINFDDPLYVNEVVQKGFTNDSLRWAFTSNLASNWHPVTWLSHMLDCQLFGMDAGDHHLMSVGLHAINALLLLWLMVRLTGAWWRGFFIAGLFALHPLRVESVAWVSERKDVLSAFFGLLTLLAYATYARKAEIGKAESRNPKRWVYYGLALGLYALGLMSKPMLVTWPFVMLLLDYWPLQRVTIHDFRFTRLRPLIAEKIPFFALTLASSIATYLVQDRTGAVASLDIQPLGTRVMTAIAAYCGYIQKLLWPTNLCIIYLPPERWELEQVFFQALLMIGGSIWVLRHAKRHSYLATGWLWYLGTLVPVIGLVQVGNQSMADRYTYLPTIGLLLLGVWGSCAVARRWRRGRTVLAAFGVGAIASCGWLTRQQVVLWKDSETLFSHGLQVSKDNPVLHNNLGTALLVKGKFAEARPHYEAALRVRPYFPDALNNMGVVLTRLGEVEEAMVYLNRAILLAPKHKRTYGELAVALAFEGRTADATRYYRRSLELEPDRAEVLNNLAWILATHPDERHRDGPEAVRLATRACELTGHKRPVCIGTLAAAYAETGQFAQAIRSAEQARELASQLGQKEIAARNAELLELYRAGKAYHEPSLPR